MGENLTLNKFQKKGYARFNSIDFGLSTVELSAQLLDDLASMKIKILPKPQKAKNIGDYIQELFLEEKDGAENLISLVYQLLPSLPSLWQFAALEKMLEMLEFFGLASVSLGTVPLVRIDRPKCKNF